MKREFLEALGLEKEAVDKILDENSRDIGREKQKAEQARADLEAARNTLAEREADLSKLQQDAGDAEAIRRQLEELQTKYDAEAQAHQEALAERDYLDAVSAATADLKFSSKAAKTAFTADLKAKKLPLKDGKLEGFEQYLAEAKKADPEAFAASKPAPAFSGPTGGGPAPVKTAGEQAAELLGKAAAQRDKAANDIISYYTGGN